MLGHQPFQVPLPLLIGHKPIYNLFICLGIEDTERKRALLLHYAGERVYDIYDAEKNDTEATFEATKKVSRLL
jgi:hypothetical protein